MKLENLKKPKKIMFSKNGLGLYTPRISLKLEYLRQMGITPEDREVEVLFEDNCIIIKKYKKDEIEN